VLFRSQPFTTIATMRSSLVFCFLCLACGSLVSAQTPTLLGRCDFIPGVSSTTAGLDGSVTFTDNGNGTVNVNVNVTGIATNGSYAIHVHTFGDISDPTGTAAGGHFNPLGQPHACPGTSARHEGDMGNWTAVNGAIQQNNNFDLLTLTGNNSIIGRAVVVHAAADDCLTQPTGAAGARQSFCVIGISNNANNTAVVNQTTGVPITNAVATLFGTTDSTGCGSYGACRGTAWFNLVNGNSVNVVVRVTSGLTFNGGSASGKYGIHIHQFGDLSDRALANSAGGHWNPSAVNHGFPTDTVHHLGDLGNIQTNDTSGYYWYNYTATYITSIEQILGRALIIHADVDHGQGQNCSTANGNAGARKMIGVIGVVNATATPVQTSPNTNNAWNAITCATTTTTAGTTIGSTSTRTSSASAIAASLFVLLAALLALLCF